VDFEWDYGNVDHIAIHGIAREEAEAAAQDPRLLQGDWEIRNDEWRLDMIGRAGDRILNVVITTRDPLVRVVTARVANRRERRRYWGES